MLSTSTTTIARVALAVMALHVIDDSFLQPANGTSAADHLVSGLVPLVVFLSLQRFLIRGLLAGSVKG